MMLFFTTACPECGQEGKEILFENIFCNLKDISQLNDKERYHFCPNPRCEVVYFSQKEYFLNSDLIRPMALKSEDQEATICYCFGYGRKDATPQNYQVFLAKLKKGCHCRTKNPSGGCCKQFFASFINL